MTYRRNKQPTWRDRSSLALSVYRLFAFATGVAAIFLSPSIHPSVVPPLILAIGLGTYTLSKVIYPLRWPQPGLPSYSLVGTDVAICIFLVLSTGGLYSPFLLYTLAPVLTSALLPKGKVTSIIAGLSATYVIGSHLANPFFPTRLSVPELSYFSIYIIAVSLAAVLPYMINVNLRQRLQSRDILRERQRLSREIHDGAAQNLAALHWQVQLLERRLAGMGIELDETKQLEKLAKNAHQDARESLDLLRNYSGDGSLLPHLQDYLEHLMQAGDIDCRFALNIENGEFRLEALAELELLRICQEALTNIRQHSGAHNVEVKVSAEDNQLKVTIADDGCGFDAIAYYRDGLPDKGRGLAVMQERAESIGGRLMVLSLPGQGTEVQAEVPLAPRRGRLLWQSR